MLIEECCQQSTERVVTVNIEIDLVGWFNIDWEVGDTDGVKEMQTHDQRMYEKTVDTFEMTKPKVSLISIDEIRGEQEKDEEYKNIRKVWRYRVPTQYHENQRGLI